MNGTVYLVGAGPGAPDLLTVRAVRVLERADVVFYDALVHAQTLAIASCAKHVAVGKRCGGYAIEQRFINKRLIDASRKYACVVRLKGGDPMLFGRAQEELDAVRAAGVRYEVIPGVTAALAASADVGVSLTRRGVSRNVVFVTPRVGRGEQSNDWLRAVLNADTAAIYMGVGQAVLIADALLGRGVPSSKPVVLIENASLPEQRIVATRLSELHRASDLGFDGPAMILIGDVYGVVGACAPRAVVSRSGTA